MTYDGLGKMFEVDSADMCGGKIPLVSMGGLAEGLACADPGARTPITASGILCKSNIICVFTKSERKSKLYSITSKL
jgi:hypothetical protein